MSAVLNLMRVRGGFLTSHLSDVVVPAWLYVTSRGLAGARRKPFAIVAWTGQSPERAAIVLFLASAATEVSQRFWPHGPFRGRFDPLDVVAFAVGLIGCYLGERLSGRSAEASAPPHP